MPIVISPSVPPVAVSSTAAATPVVLQPGTVISAKVLQILTGDTVRIAIGGQSLDVQSRVPLQAGQTLQLAVSQTGAGINLAVVNQPDTSSVGQADGAASATAASDTVTLAPDAAASIAAQTPATAAARVQLTPQEQLAVTLAAQTAATQQTSLAPLFANLDVAASLSTLPPQVQQAVAQVLTQRVSLDPSLTGDDIQQAFQGSGLFLEASLANGSVASSGAVPDLKAALIVLRQVLTTSLEGATATQVVTAPGVVPAPGTTSLATVVQFAPQPGAVASGVQGATPAVIVLQQGAQSPAQNLAQPVTISVGTQTQTTASQAPVPLLTPASASPEILLHGAAASVAQDLLNFTTTGQIISPAATPTDAAARSAASSAALNLLQEALQAGPLPSANLSQFVLDHGALLSLVPATAGVRANAVDDGEFAHTNVPPPPISGALPAAQPIVAATLVSNSSAETAMHHLLADTDGAIARQTLLQVASLPDRVDAAGARIDTGGPRWNFEIPFVTPQGTAMAQFEISRDSGANEVEAAKRVWRARFSLDVEPAGPVHALVSLNGDRTSVRMWAERPGTAARLRAGAAQLSQALSKAELLPGDIVIRDGAPVQTALAPAGHFLNRAL